MASASIESSTLLVFTAINSTDAARNSSVKHLQFHLFAIWFAFMHTEGPPANDASPIMEPHFENLCHLILVKWWFLWNASVFTNSHKRYLSSLGLPNGLRTVRILCQYRPIHSQLRTAIHFCGEKHTFIANMESRKNDEYFEKKTCKFLRRLHLRIECAAIFATFHSYLNNRP